MVAQQLEHADIQGLVVSGYGHLKFGSYIFITFNDAHKGKSWLKSFIPNIATAEKWDKDEDGNTQYPPTAMNIAFSYTGLRTLVGFETTIEPLPYPFMEGITEEQRADKVLGDTGVSDPKNWEIGALDRANDVTPNDMHAIIVLLTETAELRESEREALKTQFAEHDISIYAEQDAAKLYADKEHFGFMDGVSQPQLEGSHRKARNDDPPIRAGEFVLGYTDEYGQYPESPALAGNAVFGKNGTYLVFRKLSQNVAAFWSYMAETAEKYDDTLHAESESLQDRMTWLASKCVGRWPSGNPLTMAPEKDDPSIKRKDINKFLFAARDPHGIKCPIGSHMRRMNPRDSQEPDATESLKMSNRHMIIRRGMPYGEPLFDLSGAFPSGKVDDDGVDRGLVFLCLNTNIERQFEFIMQTWSNNTKFHALYDERDPIIGNNDNGGNHTIQATPIRKRVENMPRFVTVKGGGYFFMPGIKALNLLADQ